MHSAMTATYFPLVNSLEGSVYYFSSAVDCPSKFPRICKVSVFSYSAAANQRQLPKKLLRNALSRHYGHVVGYADSWPFATEVEFP
jgi:hypothetical protein